MPDRSQLPIIVWPRWADSASWWTQSGSFSAGARRSTRKRGGDQTAVISAASDVRNRPPTAKPTPTTAAAYSPRTNVPAIGAAGRDAGRRGAEAEPEREPGGHDGDRREGAEAAGDDPAARPSGRASSISSRPPFSSEAHPATSVAPARPAKMNSI